MRAIHFKASLIRSGLAAAVLLGAATASYAQTTVGLTAAPTQAVLPDGQSVPMWGYTCGTVSPVTSTCAAANANAGSGNWSPVVITVPYTQDLSGVSSTILTISLTNSLSFAAGTGTNTLPTSLVIVGQLGGGLGAAPVTTLSPTHAPQGPTWPASGGPDPSVTTCNTPADRVAAAAAGTNCPPPQPNRVQSFATEVAAGATTTLPTWSNLKPGTYLIESGTHPSIQGPMGLYGVLVVTTAPTTGPIPGVAYYKAGAPVVNYDSELPLVLSEIDAVQNRAVDAAVKTAGFSETKVWNGQSGQCGDLTSATANTCYPPAVNYDPRYFLINGVSFDASASWKSQFATTGAATGSILVRFVNAGLRMHVPSIVGAQTGTPAVPGVSLIAEDGNVLPGVPKVQSEVFLAAGKTQDVLINDPALAVPALSSVAVFDRHLSLTTNNRRGGGMMANIARGVGISPGPVSPGSANPETYYCVAGTTLAVTDPSKGVLANDPGANGAVLQGTPTGVTFNSNGTFTYTPPASGNCTTSFTYLVNGLVANIETATIQRCDNGGGNGANGCTVGGAPVAADIQFFSTVNSRFAASPPGVLKGATDPNALALTAVKTASVNADGSFIVS